MGFSNLLKCIKNSKGQNEKFDWRNESDAEPWIVVDFNNVVMDMSIEGGHCAFMKARCECLFGALANSGANICIVLDGKYCSEERSVIKLGRMHKEIKQRKNKGTLLTSDCVANLAYSIFEKTFDESLPRCVWHTADGEADDYILKFAEEKLELGYSVYIVSSDMSLALGLNPKNLFLVLFANLTPSKDVNGSYILEGPIYPLEALLQELSEATDKYFKLESKKVPATTESKTITKEMLIYISALLSGETDNIRWRQYDSPNLLLSYMSKYLNLKANNNSCCWEEKKLYELYAAVAFVRCWNCNCEGDIEFRTAHIMSTFINVITKHARGIFPEYKGYKKLFGLKCRNSTGLHYPARNLLHRTCKVGEGDSI